jgi:hypothetical protein
MKCGMSVGPKLSASLATAGIGWHDRQPEPATRKSKVNQQLRDVQRLKHVARPGHHLVVTPHRGAAKKYQCCCAIDRGLPWRLEHPATDGFQLHFLVCHNAEQ